MEKPRVDSVHSHHIVKESLKPCSVFRNVINMACDYCCFVDGSWISLANRTGIGWVLYNKNAKFVLRGMASISPLGTPIEVEAEALRMAMVHLKRLGYHRVTFCGDNSVLFQNINVLSDTQQQQCWEYSSISTHLQISST